MYFCFEAGLWGREISYKIRDRNSPTTKNTGEEHSNLDACSSLLQGTVCCLYAKKVLAVSIFSITVSSEQALRFSLDNDKAYLRCQQQSSWRAHLLGDRNAVQQFCYNFIISWEQPCQTTLSNRRETQLLKQMLSFVQIITSHRRLSQQYEAQQDPQTKFSTCRDILAKPILFLRWVSQRCLTGRMDKLRNWHLLKHVRKMYTQRIFRELSFLHELVMNGSSRSLLGYFSSSQMSSIDNFYYFCGGSSPDLAD